MYLWVARLEKVKRPNLAISSFKKRQIYKNEIKTNFLQKFVKITRFKLGTSNNIASYAQIFPTRALKYTLFCNIPKRPKMAKL